MKSGWLSSEGHFAGLVGLALSRIASDHANWPSVRITAIIALAWLVASFGKHRTKLKLARGPADPKPSPLSRVRGWWTYLRQSSRASTSPPSTPPHSPAPAGKDRP